MALTTDVINELIGIKESYQASDALKRILFDQKARRELFMGFLEHDKRMDRDWFHVYFEEKHANKQKFGQDFTPASISGLISKIVDDGSDKKGGIRFDPTAGTGSLIIQKWHADMVSHSIFDYAPSLYLYHCEELSDGALPFLLFNLMIRGMNAVVVHGDVLEREAKQVYFIQNDEDNFLGFSNLNVMPHNKEVESYFDIRLWKEDGIEHIESEFPPRYLKGVIEVG